MADYRTTLDHLEDEELLRIIAAEIVHFTGTGKGKPFMDAAILEYVERMEEDEDG